MAEVQGRDMRKVEQREASQNVFDAKASEWDLNPLVVEACREEAKVLKEEVLRPGMVAMDFGCGTGLLAWGIADAVKLVVGVDSSEGMIQVLRGKIDAAPGCNVRAACVDLQDATSLHAANDPANPFPEQFDLITSSLTFHHIEDIPAVLRLLVGHLKPGGRLAVFDYRKLPGSHRFHPPEVDHTVHHKAGFSHEEFCEYFSGAGLQDVSCRTVRAFTKPAGDDPSQRMDVELLMALGTWQG